MRKLLVIIAAVAATQLSPVLAADQTADDLIERAEKAFASQLALTRASDSGQSEQASWLTHDVVYEYAQREYALRGIDVNFRVKGRAAVTAHLQALADVAPDAIVENIRFFPTLEPDVVFVQYDLVAPDDFYKRSSTVATIQIRGDQIAKFTQLNRTPESLQAMKAPPQRIN